MYGISMHRRLRRISGDRGRFCQYCDDGAQLRRWQCTKEQWSERLRCDDGSYICIVCYYTVCHPRGFCRERQEIGICDHSVRLARGEERKLPADDRPKKGKQ